MIENNRKKETFHLSLCHSMTMYLSVAYFQKAFVCWALQRLVKICVFNVFLCKKLKKAKKQENCIKIEQQTFF